MGAKKEVQEAAEKVTDLKKKENSLWEGLKNKGLKRTLTDHEIAVVKWYVENVLSVSKTDKLRYDTAVRSIIEIGHIENIMKVFQKSSEQGFTVAYRHRRAKSGSMLEAHIVRNKLACPKVLRG